MVPKKYPKNISAAFSGNPYQRLFGFGGKGSRASCSRPRWIHGCECGGPQFSFCCYYVTTLPRSRPCCLPAGKPNSWDPPFATSSRKVSGCELSIFPFSDRYSAGSGSAFASGPWPAARGQKGDGIQIPPGMVQSRAMAIPLVRQTLGDPRWLLVNSSATK